MNPVITFVSSGAGIIPRAFLHRTMQAPQNTVQGVEKLRYNLQPASRPTALSASTCDLEAPVRFGSDLRVEMSN